MQLGILGLLISCRSLRKLHLHARAFLEVGPHAEMRLGSSWPLRDPRSRSFQFTFNRGLSWMIMLTRVGAGQSLARTHDDILRDSAQASASSPLILPRIHALNVSIFVWKMVTFPSCNGSRTRLAARALPHLPSNPSR
ncbi:hypothetical protein BOTBODRAFT_244406 [Botryobasidium botryosum FD-172 SS1]|uniref:Uncharacterized protein n=1 Tax=Botryobasidium botryosum (strain FD-172 SS1) TaxID=930990 RepID=A0A067LWN0_BOTB1|nr:hypothetical protein BOTBODRAFT_244406 [Botryobasidium botryosum FD-172 SS1]